ncbi:hypothetical protein AB3Y40_09975 [Yoonia sp. R2331]|uniref:hypothetical protein n=1 Tax=Yoonia sp. R2331 TaxID=3237238 RepID=UPI0034E4D12D
MQKSTRSGALESNPKMTFEYLENAKASPGFHKGNGQTSAMVFKNNRIARLDKNRRVAARPKKQKAPPQGRPFSPGI